MKKIIALLMTVASLNANADSWQTTNQNGRRIVLTETPCTGKVNQWVAFTQSSNAQTLFGCWFYSEGFAMVIWSDGDVRTYPANTFVKVTK